jgi:hypothetical protein
MAQQNINTGNQPNDGLGDFLRNAFIKIQGNFTELYNLALSALQKDALAGTSGTPSDSNRYVTNSDERLSNSRTPSGTAGGDLSGDYPNPLVKPDAIDNEKLANVPQNTIKGRVDTGLGDPQDLTPEQAREVLDVFSKDETPTKMVDLEDIPDDLSGHALKLVRVKSDESGFELTESGAIYSDEDARDAISAALDGGDLNVVNDDPADKIVATIKDGVVSNAKLSNMPARTIKGRVEDTEESEGTGGVPMDLSPFEAREVINVYSKEDVDDMLSNIPEGYNDERAQDAVGTILDDGTFGDAIFTYDDDAPKIFATIKAKAISFTRIIDITANRLLGRIGTDGSIQEIPLGTGLSFDGGILSAVGGGGGPAIADNYADVAALIAAQGTQEENALYYVADASADATVDAGWAVYRYLGTTVGDLTDYQKLSEEESLDVIFSISDADETTKGIVEEATDAETQAGTATGGTSAKLFVTPAKLATWWTWVKTQAQTFADLTATVFKVSGQAAASGKKNPLHITDDGTIIKNSWVEVDTATRKTTSTGVDDLEASTIEEWKNLSGVSIMKILNGLKVEFGGTSSFLEVQSGITDGNAGIIFQNAMDIAYRLKDHGSFDYLQCKSSTGGYGRALIIRQKQVNNHGQGFETVRRQFKLTLPNTTAGAAHIVGSIDIPAGYAIELKVMRALAFATNGNVQGCEPFGSIGRNSAGTTSGSATVATALWITATSGGFSVVFNDTTDTADITFTNETGTGRQYDVLVDVEYILYPIPV